MVSFDIVGDIAIVKYRENEDMEKVADEILKKHKNVKNVAVDYGVYGEERIRKIELIRGTHTETIHREFGVRIKVDISKVYFSPRLATERWGVVQRVKDGETIYDMFAGCGPFSIMIAKYKKVRIFASDINRYAILYLTENIKLNKIKGVYPMLGDSRIISGKIPKVDRIIMNLPHSSSKFIPYALNAIKKGGEIHYYEILPRDQRVLSRFDEMGVKNVEIIDVHRVHEYSPAKTLFSFLLRII